MSNSQHASSLALMEMLFENGESVYIIDNKDIVDPLDIPCDKQVFTDSVYFCMDLLRQSNRLTSNRSETTSLQATLMGHEMFQRIIAINVQMDVETEDETFAYSGQPPLAVKKEPKTDYEEMPYSQAIIEEEMEGVENEDKIEQAVEVDEKEDHKKEKEATTPVAAPVISDEIERESTKICTRSSTRRSLPMVVEIPRETASDLRRHSQRISLKIPARNIDDKQLPPPPVSLSGSYVSMNNSRYKKPVLEIRTPKVIPLELKQKVVNLARANPTWTIEKLQKESKVSILSNSKQLNVWKKQVDAGGTKYDKCHTINNLTYQRFLAARAKSQCVSAHMIRYWAIEIARDVYGGNSEFEATGHWMMNFKKLYKLHWSNTSGYHQKNEKRATKIARLPKKKKKSTK